MDSIVERLARSVARGTSRRGFIAKVATLLIGGAVIPLLPVNRVVKSAEAIMASGEPGVGGASEPQDPASCDYWRYCGFDGYLCSCCGGAVTQCPAGTMASPTSWVGSCRHPEDGREYIIAYRDCCGKDACNRCYCDNNKGQTPIYRPQSDNDIVWCFGANSFAYHCTTAVRLGAAS